MKMLTMKNMMRFEADAREDELRQAIVEAGRIAYERGLLAANDGNLSVRMPGDRILITPSGVSKGRLSPDDLLVIDLSGAILKQAEDPRLRSTSEQPMHLEVYRQRPDVRAVLHAHPPYATALTASRPQIRLDILPEMVSLLGEVPVTDLAMPSTHQSADVIRELIRHHDALMIRQHGSLTVGRDMEEALVNLERLEHVAKTIVIAELLGNVKPLPAEMLRQLERQRLESLVQDILLQTLQGGGE